MKFAFLLFVFVQSAITSLAQQTEPPYKRFPTLPPLKLLLTDSTTRFTEKELKKDLPVFVILFSPDCEHCKKGTEELIDNIDRFKNIQIVMTTIQPFDKMKEFYENYKLDRFKDITVGRDEFFLLPTFYRIKNMPFLAFYDKKGDLIDIAEGALPVNKVLEFFQE
ncbi:MAG TPA: thioredoxin [Chitinophagaceae bacterium]|nr:thioredoxin [Chitinophagaceae bacterium]